MLFPSLAAPDSQLLNRLDIQRGLFSDTYQTFDINDQQVIYILQENTTAITRGVAVMISDAGVPLVGQEGFLSLANELNKIGWVTILLTAPDTGFMPAIAQEANLTDEAESTKTQAINSDDTITDLDISQSAVTSIDEQAFVAHEQYLTAILQAVIEKSQEYPGFFLVISKGTSAAWLTKVYAEKTFATPDAFVAINPFWPDRKYNQHLPEWMANTPMPVLDLYSERGNKWAQATVDQREIAAIKSLKLHYRQRELLGFNIYQQHSAYISKEIYGWISHMGW